MNGHSQKAQKFFLFLCGCIWGIAAIGTHIPAEHIPKTGYSDKTLHLLGYTILAGSFLLAMWSRRFSRKKRILRAIIILLVYAALDEITQPLVNRYASVLDWVADAAGVGVAVLVDLIIGWKKAIIRRLKTDKA